MASGINNWIFAEKIVGLVVETQHPSVTIETFPHADKNVQMIVEVHLGSPEGIEAELKKDGVLSIKLPYVGLGAKLAYFYPSNTPAPKITFKFVAE